MAKKTEEIKDESDETIETMDEPEKKPSAPKKLKVSDVEKLVVELAKEGKSPAQIGLRLRDKHGVPKVRSMGKKLTQILDEQNIEYSNDKDVIDAKVEKLKKHLEGNKHDYPASRALSKKLWAIRAFEKRNS